MAGAGDAHARWRDAVRLATRGHHGRAARLLERLVAEPGTDATLGLRCRISLALARYELTGVATGLSALDDCRPAPGDDVDQHAVGVWFGQRGLMLLRGGRLVDAQADLDRAVALLDPTTIDAVLTLLNRGVLALRTGDLAAAEADTRRSFELAEAGGHDLEAAKAVGNLAYLAHLRADLPTALRLIVRARAVMGSDSTWMRGTSARGHAEMLQSAGLLHEAGREYAGAVRLLRSPAFAQDRANAQLGLAEVSRLVGDLPAARRWARRALTTFARRESTGWALLAELELAQIEHLARPALAVDLTRGLVPRLQAQGLREEAHVARLLLASSLARAGRGAEAAATRPDEAWAPREFRVSTRMLGHEARAAVEAANGLAATAQRSRARGLRDLHEVQAGFGSVDLLTSATRIGRQLARDGLAEALRGGDPDEVLAWSEQVRATGSRVLAVRPPQDGRVGELLAHLRFLQQNEQAARVCGADPGPWGEQAAAVREQVRALAWQASGAGEVLGPVDRDRLVDALGGATLVSLLALAGRVHALVVDRDGARVVPLGASAQVREDVLRVRADLDLLAGRALPEPLRRSVSGSLRSGLGRFAALVAPALDATSGPVVLVPSGQSAMVPWTMLPQLRGREVSVVPSATWWVDRTSRAPRGGGRTVLVAGPDVPRAEPEVHAVARGTDATVLTGDDATVAATLAALDGAQVLHVAAHGRHEPDNPLFSSLLLADGWLYGHDLDAVARLPEHVVLSACEAGTASIRPGDEALGTTAALLHGGTRSVVASVARVGDDVAEAVAARHHAGLRAGLPPAAALASALGALDDGAVAPLVCFGAG